jgi:hypothetical protein
MSIKVVRSPEYNYTFNDQDGFFARWGKTKEDDPVMSPFGCEILDMELSTICFGQGNAQKPAPCKFCYKSNTSIGTNMSFETAKVILDKMPKTLCQVAYGIGSLNANPDLWKIMEYTRSIGLVPNITVNGHDIDDEDITKLANLCGAVAVSHYSDADCFGTVKRLTEEAKKEGTTLRQVNIHQICCLEKYEECRKVVHAMKNDERLSDCNALVLMTLKPIGKRNILHSLNSLEKFQALFKEAVDAGVKIGMDSCSAPQTFRAIESLGMLNVSPSIESCESAIFSFYCDVNGFAFPCSFSSGIGEWKEGISIVEAQDFVKDVWYHPKIVAWRERLLARSNKCDCQFKSQCRPCPLFDEVTPCYKK